ncbi:MAG: DUF4912 domain-containing protein [Candidatus Omnitrophica bacterium]|nr:DUF4912 domain-containing protein [Candidatus Omnitrophota bacterium]
MAVKSGRKVRAKKVKSVSRSKRSVKPKVSPRPISTPGAFGSQEMAVERTKFAATQEMPRVAARVQRELPAEYGSDRIVLATRDPWWIHAYWEVAEAGIDNLKNKLGQEFVDAKMILRVYDVSYLIFNGSNANSFFDIEIEHRIGNWYIQVSPGRSWCVDIGFRLKNGKFIMLCRSNTVLTPLAGPSWITDEEWMIPDDMFARLYGLGFGFGSSPAKGWQERLKKALFSGALSSPGLASPVKLPKEKKFWLVVNTELIVYGATEPGAKVSVQGKAIKLRPDGTFSLRFALPDGKQVIPIEALPSDKSEKKTITPIVIRETK